MESEVVGLDHDNEVSRSYPSRARLDTSAGDRDVSASRAQGGLRPRLLLDRDGTIILDHSHVGSIDRVEFIDVSLQAIARFNQAGIAVAVITNQAGVPRGLYGIDDATRAHRYSAERMAEHEAHVDPFFYSPY